MAAYGLRAPQILDITRARFLDHFDHVERDFNEARNKLDQFNKGKELNYKNLDEKMKKKFDKIEKALQKGYQRRLAQKTQLESKQRRHPRLTRRVNAVALVTIKSADQAELFLRYAAYEGFCAHFCYVFRILCRFFNCGRKNMKFLTPPPTKDILWDHVGFCTFNRYMRYFFISLLNTPIMLVFVLIMAGFTILKISIKSTGGIAFVYKVIFGYLLPFIIIKLSHKTTDAVLLKLSRIGKEITASSQRNFLMQFNYTFKVMVCAWALSIKYIIRWFMVIRDDVQDTDLYAFYSSQVFFYVLSDVGFSALKKIVDLPILVKKFEIQRFEKNFKKKNGDVGKTQGEVNELYTKPEFQLMDQYIEMMFQCYFCFKFSLYSPVTVFIIFAYIVIKYCRDKVNLVKNRRPPQQTEHIFSDYAWKITFPVSIWVSSVIYSNHASPFLAVQAPWVAFWLFWVRWIYCLIAFFNSSIQSLVVKLAQRNFDRRMQREIVRMQEMTVGVNPEVSLEGDGGGELGEGLKEPGSGSDEVFRPRPLFGSMREMEEELKSPGYTACLRNYMNGGWFDK